MHDISIVKNFVDECDFLPCILDIEDSFAKANAHLPSNNAFHSFFINKKNEVVLVGDPTTNSAVGKLFQKHILEQNDKNRIEGAINRNSQ